MAGVAGAASNCNAFGNATFSSFLFIYPSIGVSSRAGKGKKRNCEINKIRLKQANHNYSPSRNKFGSE